MKTLRWLEGERVVDWGPKAFTESRIIGDRLGRLVRQRRTVHEFYGVTVVSSWENLDKETLWSRVRRWFANG